MTLTIAVDLGNAQLRVAAIDPHEGSNNVREPRIQEIKGEQWDLSKLDVDPTIIDKVVELVASVAGTRKSEVGGVGVSCVAAVDDAGNIHLTQTKGGREEQFLKPLSAKLEKRLGRELEVIVGNRSDMGAWGEYKYGWGGRNLVYLTISGIVSAGIVTNQQLYLGTHGFAGQIGHMLVDPTSTYKCDVCGQSGCLSSLVGGRAMMRQLDERRSEPAVNKLIQELAAAKQKTSAIEDAGHIQRIDTSVIDARSVIKAARRDPTAQAIVLKIAKPLGRAIADITGLLDPGQVILGGIAYDAEFLEFAAANEARQYLPAYRQDKNKLERSRLRDEAPLYGAAAWVWDKHRLSP